MSSPETDSRSLQKAKVRRPRQTILMVRVTSKVRYIPLSQEDETAMRWLQYAIDLLGDPELPIRTETPKNFSILMPSQIPARKQTLAISVSEIGYDTGSVQVRNATVCTYTESYR